VNLAEKITVAATLLVLAVFLLAGGSRSYAYYTISGPGALDWGATGVKVAGILLAGLMATLLAGIRRLSFAQKMSVSATLLAQAAFWIIVTRERYASLTIAQIELGTAILASGGILIAGGAVCLLLGIRRRGPAG
jgi:fermentation-respiration switch protein FrsA (DUF1100 family)